MKNPANLISPERIKQVLLGLFLLNIPVIYVMQVMGKSLLPYTIIGFEFAGTLESANAMIDTWKMNPEVFAKLNFMMGFDYLFMITYSSFLMLSSGHIAARMEKGVLNTVGIMIAWLQPIAAILDAVENYALWKLILGTENTIYPVLAKGCAIPKFAIVAIGVIFLLVGGTYWGIRQFKRHR